MRFLAVVLADRVSISESLLAAAPLRGKRFSCLPTILAWELGPGVSSLGLGERWPPWARIWNGSNSAFRCCSTCNGTTAKLRLFSSKIYRSGRVSLAYEVQH